MSLRAGLSRPAARAARRVGGGVERGVDAVASELRAARDALPLGPQGMTNFRKWLGWASYRFAAWLNPDVRDLD